MVCLGNAMLCPVALCVCGSCFFALHACHRLPPASNLSHTTCPTYPHTTDSLHYTLHWTLYTVHNSFTPSMTSSRLKPQLNSFSQTCDTTFTHTQLALNWAIRVNAMWQYQIGCLHSCDIHHSVFSPKKGPSVTPSKHMDQGGFEPAEGGALHANGSLQPETFDVIDHCLFPKTAPNTFLKESHLQLAS